MSDKDLITNVHPAPRAFPNEGCRQAFGCGREYVEAGGAIERVGEALRFCDTPLEEAYFLFGCAAASRDLEELV